MGDRTKNQAIALLATANLKKPEKFHTLVQVSVESDVQEHQKSVKLARPLDYISLLRR